MEYLARRLDLSKKRNFSAIIIYRLVFAIAMRPVVHHCDEYWQATEPAYKFAFGDVVDVNLPWEWHESYRLRSTVYVWYLAVPLKLLRFLDLDYPILIVNSAYIMQALIVIVADWHFYNLAVKHIGQRGAFYAYFLYLVSFFNASVLHRTLGNSVESLLSIIALYYFLEPIYPVKKGFLPSKNTAKYITLISISFMIRNTSPLGWLPLLFYRLIF